jgi:hypothetical protein
MAKALFGFTAGTYDPRLVAELRGLRTRVRDLEDELERSRTENAVLAAALEVVDGADTAADVDVPMTLPEPAYS